MDNRRTYYISGRIVERAQPLLDSGRFDTFSELCRYAVRAFQEWLDEDADHVIVYMKRTGDYKRSLPLNEWVMRRISEHQVANADIVDYALDFYLRKNGL